MFLSELPTGLLLALMVGAVISVAGLAVAIVMAIARTTTQDTQVEAFKKSIEEITTSELEQDRKEKNIVNPKTWEGYWYKLVEDTGRQPATTDQPSNIVLVSIVVLAAVGLLVFPGGIMGLIALPVGAVILASAVLKAEAKKRISTLNKQLPQLIAGLMANILASQTPQNSLIAVAEEMPSPLGDELKIMKRELEVNVPLNDALDRLAERVPSREIQFLVSAIKIASASGEDLVPQLRVIDRIVVSRTRLNQKLSSAISGVSPTIWVSAITIPAMFVFQYISSVENRGFWFTITGIVCLVIVSALYAGGLWISKKMVSKIEEA